MSPTFGQNFSSSITRLASPWRAARNFKLPPQPEEHPRCQSARPSSNVRQVESLRRRPVRVERGSSGFKRNQVPPGGLVAIFSRPKKKQKKGAQGHADAQIKRSQLSGGFSFLKKEFESEGVILRMLPAKRPRRSERREEAGRDDDGPFW